MFNKSFFVDPHGDRFGERHFCLLLRLGTGSQKFTHDSLEDVGVTEQLLQIALPSIHCHFEDILNSGRST
jgi:hypothetical protein